MTAPRTYHYLLLSLLLISSELFAQPGFQIKLDKPQEYEERLLRSERTPEKKIRTPQRILQNTITRYNYFFNASNKLNEVIGRAKTAFRDEFASLLPFYNYTLEKTAEDAIQLDSIIWKSNSGIALHDLRNDWTDDLYLLWGAAYYFQRKFDSARILFQFINQAYAPREKDGYTKTIGSARDGNSALSISTPEKKSRLRKVFSGAPPRRNDAFLWQIRNYIADNRLAEAASLIEALRRDPSFPDRLKEELHEVQAWWFYQQQQWDSTAHHLSQALGQAQNQNERARWEFLLGQLYERSNKWTAAEKFYSRAIPRTTDPILEIYARLGSIRTNRDKDSDQLNDNIRDLRTMAKRDKYTDYRDIIYFMAAQMQRQTGDWAATKELLLNSVQVASNNPSQRNQAFEQLATICLQQKEYRQAYNFYDSIQLNDPKLPNPDSIRQRKEVLGLIATQMEIIERQDSLLKIISLPEEERKEFVRKLLKELRRKQGLKDDAGSGVKSMPNGGAMFGGGGDTKGEWYFYNANSRSRGLAEFQARWGNRPNTDNWRRSSVLSSGTQPMTGGSTQPGTGGGATGSELNFETLYASLPLSPEQQKILHDSLQKAWFVLGKTYIQRMEDCGNGIAALERIVNVYPSFQPMDEALFLLYYCYARNNDTENANRIRKRMETDFSSSEKTALIVSGKDPVEEKKKQATATYQSVYELFLSGRYNEAMQQKKSADSLYGRNYWTPQLMYVESVYYVQQRADSIAINRLNYLVQNFQSSPLASKAETMIRVLVRRDSIERELRDYKPVGSIPPADKPVDSTKRSTPKSDFQFAPNGPQQFVIILQDVDAAYSNEAKNALFRFNRSNYYNLSFQLELIKLNDRQQLLLVSPFKNVKMTTDYGKEIKRLGPTEIFPWLPADRYRLGIIDAHNLNKVRADKTYEGYENFLRKEQPGLFQ